MTSPDPSYGLPPTTPAAGTPAPGTGMPPAGPTPGAPATTTPAPTAKRGRSRARGLGLTVAAALLIFVTVLFVLFIVFNTQTVQISLVFDDVRAPLVVALLIAAGLGGLLVGLFSLVRRSRRSSK